MSEYASKTAYAKYLKTKCSGSTSGCEGCGGGELPECSECCPPGLVAVKGADGSHQGCLTPGDAELFLENTRTCTEGNVKLYKNTPTPEFLGCVPAEDFAALYAAVNPV